MQVQFLILVFGLNLCAVTAFSSGLVDRACLTMMPLHRTFNSSTLTPPYTITSNVSTYTDGQVITVTLQANGTVFKGFLLQARDETGPVGTFTVLGENAQLLNCVTEGSAVSHNSNQNKSTIMAQWKAPNSDNRDIRFRATFVQSFSVFWVGVETDLIRFMGTNPPNTTALPTNSTVLPTNSTVLPTNSTILPTNSTILPTNSTILPTNSTILPTNSTVLPTNSTILPTNSTILPTNSTILPTNSTILPTNSTILPTNSTVLPTSMTTPDSSSPSMSFTVCLLLLPLLAIL